MRWETKSVLVGLVAIFTLVVGTAGVASAQDGDPYVGPAATVQSATTVLEPAAAPAAQVLSASVSAAEVKGSSLAFTGGDVAALSVIGLAAIVAGVLMVGARRRSAAA